MGFDLAQAMPSPFSTRWDARGPEALVCDFDWIGEDADGIWLRVDPSAALSQLPALWPIVDQVSVGGLEEMSRSDWESLSAYHHAAKRVLVSTLNRRARV